MYITKRRKKNNQERREKKMERVSYSDNELKIVGNYMGTSASAPRYNTPVTPRENINQWIRGEKPLWFPTTDDFVFITPRIIADNIARGFAFECLPPLTAEESGGPDMFGTEWVYVPQVGGSMVKPGIPGFRMSMTGAGLSQCPIRIRLTGKDRRKSMPAFGTAAGVFRECCLRECLRD